VVKGAGGSLALGPAAKSQPRGAIDVFLERGFAGVDPDPATLDEIRRWTVDYFEALHPHSAGGAYVNMMMDEGQDRVRDSYRDNYDRLAEIKAKYDPGNLFRVNQNIEPAASNGS
jgi:Berberine and berberine like